MKRSKRKLLSITGLSNEVFELFRFELNMFILRLNTKLNPFKRHNISRFKKNKNIRLNIGAGPFGQIGWVNIDMFKYKNITFTYDCRKRLPFADESVSKIRCEHVLEHMDRIYEVPSFLSECNRVLQSGGVVRIIVPDIEKYIKAYYENDWTNVGLQKVLTEPWQAANILTHTFRQGGEHKFGYDFPALKKVLNDSGFQFVNRMNYRVSCDNELEFDQSNHASYSLYVEAIKSI